jgi:diacylglycerol kinase (ATP)
LLTIFPKVFFGKHIPHPKIDVYRGKEVSISGNTKAFADGEYIDDLPIRIQNIQNSLSTWLFA